MRVYDCFNNRIVAVQESSAFFNIITWRPKGPRDENLSSSRKVFELLGDKISVHKFFPECNS